MVENKTPKEPIPSTFETFEEMADFWDTHDVTDYEEYLTPVEVNVSTHPKHKYICDRKLTTFPASYRRISNVTEQVANLLRQN
jgi:hypothetical protein